MRLHRPLQRRKRLQRVGFTCSFSMVILPVNFPTTAEYPEVVLVSGFITLLFLRDEVVGLMLNFLHPTLPVSFGIDTESHWSLPSGVFARGVKDPTH